MYYKDDYFPALTYEELYYTLKSINNNDCYLEEFLDNNLLEELVYQLDVHDIVFIASDDRVLLTSKGEKLMQRLNFSVECNKYSDKVLKIKL